MLDQMTIEVAGATPLDLAATRRAYLACHDDIRRLSQFWGRKYGIYDRERQDEIFAECLLGAWERAVRHRTVTIPSLRAHLAFLCKAVVETYVGNNMYSCCYSGDFVRKLRRLRAAMYALESEGRTVITDVLLAKRSKTNLAMARRFLEGKLDLFPPVSLSNPLRPDRDDSGTIEDVIACPDPEPLLDRERSEVATALATALSQLSAREELIIHSRIFCDDERGKKLREVAEILDLTTERVRQIQLQALAKLQRHLRSNGLTFQDLWLGS